MFHSGCDMCQEVRFGECPQHGPLPSLRPSLILPGPKSYAISTFPDEVGLCISTLPLAGYGVFARHFIPRGTWIGPYEGKKIPVEDGMKQISQGDAPFLWEVGGKFGSFPYVLLVKISCVSPCFSLLNTLVHEIFAWVLFSRILFSRTPIFFIKFKVVMSRLVFPQKNNF